MTVKRAIALGSSVVLAVYACAVPYLDEKGKACTETCPSGLPCVRGICGGEDVDSGNAPNDGGNPVADASSSSGDDAGDGGGIDAGPPLNMYTYAIQTNRWSKNPLSAYFNGPNAPPVTGIVAAVKLIDIDRLLVFTADDKYYWRKDGVWQPPSTVAEKWAPMTKSPRGVTHIPYYWKQTLAPPQQDTEDLTVIDNPTFYIFKYQKTDAIVFQNSDLINPKDGGEPVRTNKLLWSYELPDLGNPNGAERYQFWDLYDDGFLYEINAAIEIKKWPLATSPFWLNHPEAPPANGVAAYYEHGSTSVHIIGP
jgi:hypothetical protein